MFDFDKRTYFFLSYISFFSAAFIGGVLISIIPTVVHWDAEYVNQNAWTMTANATMVNVFNSLNIVSLLPVLTLAFIILGCILFFTGGLAMDRGMGM